MLQSLKRFAWLGLLVAGVPSSFGFSLGGPTNNEVWQVIDIGYSIPGFDVNTPKNLGEEYRRTTPVMYYAIDSNFRDYFGSNGVYAIDQAFAIFNNLTNVSQYSVGLNEVPSQAQRENYLAESLFLTDLKSHMLWVLCEQMGLADPERYVWTLHDRDGPSCPPAPCPVCMAYTVVQRSFDPVPSPLNQFQSSSYINGTLYSYYIFEHCAAPPPWLAWTVPFKVDPLDFGFSSVAGNGDITPSAVSPFLGPFHPTLNVGQFYTGLTRDDVGGLRYLLRTNNVKFETSGSNTFTFVTNIAPQLLITSNLTDLASLAVTNDAPTLTGLVPGLLIAATSNYWATIWVTNVTSYFTNFPWDAVGDPATLVFSTNRTLTVQNRYHHTFGNVMGIRSTTNGYTTTPIFDVESSIGPAFGLVQTQTVGPSPWSTTTNAVFSTNTTSRYFLTNEPAGEYFLLPGTNCDMAILATILTNLVTTTNLVALATNITVSTNGFTNFQSFAQFEIDYSTNHAFVANPVICPSSAGAWRQGIEHVTFVRIPDNNFDETTYSLYVPITNDYTVMAIDPTNNVMYPLRNRRTVVFPDILITAQDLASNTGDPGTGAATVARNVNFATNGTLAYQGMGGPGTIEPVSGVIFDKVGPIYEESSPILFPGEAYNSALAEADQIPILIWGSFDGSTNLPVVYPNGTSIASLQNQLLIRVQPTTLPNGIVGVPYPTIALAASGGNAPYTFALAPGSPGLPPGMTLSSGGTISGVPTQSGIFDFVVRVTDSTSVSVDFNYALTINP